MRSTVVFLASLLLFSVAVNAAEVSSLAEIENHPFGNAMMNLIQMNLKQENTKIDTIRSLIKDIKDSLVGVQEAEYNEFQEYTKTNKKNIDDQNAIVEKYTDQKLAEENSLSTNTQNLNSKTADKKSKESDLELLQKKIQEAKAENEAKLAEYSQKVTDLNDLISACTQATELLNTMKFNPATVSLIMVSFNTHMERIKTGIKKIKKSNAAYASMLNALTDLASHADPQSVQNIIALINKLKSEFDSELSSVITNEEKRKVDYAALLVRYGAEESKLIGEISDLTTAISELDAAIAKNNQNITLFSENISAAQAIIATLQETYSARLADFNKNQASRKSEIDILTSIQNHFENKIVPEYNNLSQSAKDAIEAK